MPTITHTFTIMPVTDKVALDTSGRGKISVTISNGGERPVRGEIKLAPLGSTRLDWIKVEGEAVRSFANKQSQQFNVQIQLPPGTAPGRYTFRPNVAAVDNPDEDFTEGPEVAFELKAMAAPAPAKKFPIWIVLVIVAVLLVGGGIAVAVLMSGGSKIEVISVIGKPAAEATHLLEQAKLKVVADQEVTHTNTPGLVFAQSPAAGQKLKEGATVTLTVEGQPASVKVPDVVGMPFAKLKDAFAEAKLDFVEKERRITGKLPAGGVIEQSPKAGELAELHSQVTLVLEADSIPVPNVVGSAFDRASADLAAGKLSIGKLSKETRPESGDNMVLRQTPAAGERVLPGSTVDLVINDKPAPAAPPRPGGPIIRVHPSIFAVPPLPAPVQSSPASGARLAPIGLPFPTQFMRSTSLQWQPVPGAASYTVEVDCLGCCGAAGRWCSDQGRSWLIRGNLHATSAPLNGLGTWPLRWRVWAVDSRGVAGNKSPWREFKFAY